MKSMSMERFLEIREMYLAWGMTPEAELFDIAYKALGDLIETIEFYCFAVIDTPPLNHIDYGKDQAYINEVLDRRKS